jgi:hypothetical protein
LAQLGELLELLGVERSGVRCHVRLRGLGSRL